MKLLSLREAIRELQIEGRIIAPMVPKIPEPVTERLIVGSVIPAAPPVTIREEDPEEDYPERHLSDKKIAQIMLISKDRKRRIAIEQRRSKRWSEKVKELKGWLALAKDKAREAESELKKSNRANELLQGMLSVREDALIEISMKHSIARQQLAERDAQILALKKRLPWQEQVEDHENKRRSLESN